MGASKNDKLFSELRINNIIFKNRLGVAPMTRMSSGQDSIPRKDVLDFLVRRARNGAAVVYTEAIVTDYESAQGYPRQSRLVTQRQIEAWKPIVEAIKKEGAVAIMQMFHCGRVAATGVNPASRVIAPSPLIPAQNNPITGSPYPMPDEMSLFDMQHVMWGFADTAKGAIAAGFDGVELHCAHGYLMNQFLSAYSNQRKDNYGGSMENRFRYVHEVIGVVRKVIPQDRLFLIRISNWGVVDMDVSLFADKAEWQEMIRLFSKEPIDAISLSTYDYKQKAFGTDKNMAQITREATKLPIFICGKIHDRLSAEEALADADLVLSAKSILLNPDWVEDVRVGKTLPVRKSEEANIAYTDTPLA
ncbi:MAG: NADH-dependent flavin oxidoreductase [Candidatus Omnitrophica bacterium]|nr:NADH-dependent flavin oxidoreductase [Candidatus Omnitrophota bacterium]